MFAESFASLPRCSRVGLSVRVSLRPLLEVFLLSFIFSFSERRIHRVRIVVECWGILIRFIAIHKLQTRNAIEKEAPGVPGLVSDILSLTLSFRLSLSLSSIVSFLLRARVRVALFLRSYRNGTALRADASSLQSGQNRSRGQGHQRPPLAIPTPPLSARVERAFTGIAAVV